MSGDILQFAEQFLAKLAAFPVQYDSTYNAPVSKGPDTAKRPTVSIVEITLKRLGSKSSTVKLSRTEPSITKLQKEASSMLDCDVTQVVLVQDGRVLKDGDAAAICKNDGIPVYVFDRRDWSGKLDGKFRDELVQLLVKYGRADAEFLTDKFLSQYNQWAQK
ncbi:hypothetical protein PSACC_03342 [Paramicrosporidium saccamoebae]|uniref:Ubiquitin-like domain-containing protein n=1 Tax=Paramicrosporidium saccamoebae TaxID=1246581 RepID=A0A2H9TGE5_9FUNG|nr:hypothetical protein PSACC_03342 [Paramicrosporidium saccamoebae]